MGTGAVPAAVVAKKRKAVTLAFSGYRRRVLTGAWWS